MTKSKKPVLAIDIDEVLVPFIGGFFLYHNAKFGTDYQLKVDMNYFGIHDIVGVSVEEMHRKIEDFVNSEAYRKGNPIEGAKKTIKKLKHHYKLVVITARPESVRDLTEDWLRGHFPETFSNVHFAEWVDGKPPNKRGVLRSVGAEILIDDNLSHIREAVSEEVRAILFGNYPWNQDNELPAGVVRAKSWDEVEEVLL